MKTTTQQAIENGQDINNTWQVIAAFIGGGHAFQHDEQLIQRFKEIHAIVQKLNSEARKNNEVTQ